MVKNVSGLATRPRNAHASIDAPAYASADALVLMTFTIESPVAVQL
jgi:hypothetical protein